MLRAMSRRRVIAIAAALAVGTSVMATSRDITMDAAIAIAMSE